MLFFAIVFAVEGIGQARVGIILQPLTYYLKTSGWTALEVTAYFGVLNFPWVIKPVFGLISDFIPLCGALLAENGRTFQQSGLFVSQQWLWFYVAIMLSAFLGGALVERLSPSAALKAAATLAAVAPIAVVLATPLLLKEPKSTASRQQFRNTLH